MARLSTVGAFIITTTTLIIQTTSVDTRNVTAGITIGNLSFGYADQPQCIISSNSTWLCTVTHNPTHEGNGKEAVYTTMSKDQGQTWTVAKPLEETFKEQYAYSTLFRSKFNFNKSSEYKRLYVLYVQNYQNVTTLPNGTKLSRQDMMGGFFFKFSDDNGVTWSEKSYQIPVRKTKIDLTNDWNGSTMMLWLVDKGFQRENSAYVAFTKINKYLITPPTSAWIIYSPNLISAKTIDEIQWKILPDDEDGIRSYTDEDVKGGCGYHGVGDNQCISSEPHIQPMGANGENESEHLYVVFRTDGGFLGAQVSHDGGNSWGNAQPSNLPMALHRIEPGSAAWVKDKSKPRPLKNPRGPITPRRLPQQALRNDGGNPADFLMLYYNNGNIPVSPRIGTWFHRNPYWLVPGWIAKGDGNNDNDDIPTQVYWGEPEVGLYVPGATGSEVSRGSGYPDFIIEQNDGNNNGLPSVWITETQKVFARLHKIDDNLLHDLIYQQDLATDIPGSMASILSDKKGTTISFPQFPSLKQNGEKIGFAFMVWFDGISNNMNATLIDTRKDGGNAAGVAIVVNNGVVELILNDTINNSTFNMKLDNQCNGWLNGFSRDQHFLSFNIDGSSRVVTVMVDGVLCDGGQQGWKIHPEPGDTFQGWSFFPTDVTNVNSDDKKNEAKIAMGYPFAFKEMRWYPRFLRTGELLSAWRYRRK